MDEAEKKIDEAQQAAALTEEAKAEEDFVNDAEDQVFNPFVEAADAKAEESEILDDADMEIPGAVGSGNLETVVPEKPVNNEVSLKNEAATAGEKISVRKGEKMQPKENVTPQESTAENVGAQMNDLLNETPATPVAESAEAAGQPKKKKTGLIVGLVVLALLLICGGVGAVLFYNWHESKDKVAADAFAKLLSVKVDENGNYVSVGDGVGVSKVDGSIVVENKNVKEYDAEKNNVDLAKIAVALGSENEAIKGAGKISFTATTNEGKDYKVSADAVYAGDAKAFVRVSDLEAIKSEIVGLIGGLTGEDDNADVKQFWDALADGIVTTVDNQWVEISDEGLSELLGDKYNNEFSCVMEAYEKVAKEQKEKVMAAYKENTFLSLGDATKDVAGAKSGLTYYEVKIDEDAAKKFSEEIEKIDTAEELAQCFESAKEEIDALSEDSETSFNELESTSAIKDDDEYDFDDEEFDAEIVEEEENKPETKIFVGIKPWSHEAKHVMMSSESESSKTSGNFELGYDAVTVSAPEGAKSVKEFAGGVFDTVKKVIVDNEKGFVAMQCDDYAEYASYYASCVEDAKSTVAELKNVTFDDFMKALLEESNT